MEKARLPIDYVLIESIGFLMIDYLLFFRSSKFWWIKSTIDYGGLEVSSLKGKNWNENKNTNSDFNLQMILKMHLQFTNDTNGPIKSFWVQKKISLSFLISTNDTNGPIKTYFGFSLSFLKSMILMVQRMAHEYHWKCRLP